VLVGDDDEWSGESKSVRNHGGGRKEWGGGGSGDGKERGVEVDGGDLERSLMGGYKDEKWGEGGGWEG